MNLKTYLTIITTVLILSCGGSGNTTSQSAEAPVNETEIVDSISTAVDEIKSDLSNETESTIQEIDSLLNDI